MKKKTNVNNIKEYIFSADLKVLSFESSFLPIKLTRVHIVDSTISRIKCYSYTEVLQTHIVEVQFHDFISDYF